jgi:hypothetical protein
MRKAVFLIAVGVLLIMPASASFVSTTNSTTFQSMVTITKTENFGSLTNGQLISSGATVDGLTYSAFVLTDGATQLDISDQFVSISGLSLGADHTNLPPPPPPMPPLEYFIQNEGATITFASPVTAFGMFFNAGLNSGTYGFTATSVGTIMNNGTAFDPASGFFFAGIISTTPFSSISFIDSGPNAAYTVPELLLGTATPEPSTLAITMTGIALLALGALKRRYF